jgi:hypothetical protein
MPAKTTPELTVDGVRLVTLCADITVYWRGSMLDRAEGILAFYERALKLIGDSVCWYETETMGDVEAIHGKVFDMLPFWLRNPKARRGIQALVLQGGETQRDASDRAFVLFYDQEQPPAMGVMRLVLPASLLERSPAAFAKLVAEITGRLDFESGHAGFALNWDSRGENALQAEEHLRGVAARYLGIDIPEINTTLVNLAGHGAGGTDRAAGGAAAGLARRMRGDQHARTLPDPGRPRAIDRRQATEGTAARLSRSGPPARAFPPAGACAIVPGRRRRHRGLALEIR